MSLDRGSTESFFKAGTVRIPPSGRGMIYLVPNSDDLLSLPAVKIIERVSANYRIIRTVLLTDLRVMRRQVLSAGATEYGPLGTLIGENEIRRDFSERKEGDQVRGSIYVPEGASVLMLVEMGLTAAESIDCDFFGARCDPCCRKWCDH